MPQTLAKSAPPKSRKGLKARLKGLFTFHTKKPIAGTIAEDRAHEVRRPWHEIPEVAKDYSYIPPDPRVGIGEVQNAIQLLHIIEGREKRNENRPGDISSAKVREFLNAKKNWLEVKKFMDKINNQLVDSNVKIRWDSNLNKGFYWGHEGSSRVGLAKAAFGSRSSMRNIKSPVIRVRVPIISSIPFIGALANDIANAVTYPFRKYRGETIGHVIRQNIANLQPKLARAGQEYRNSLANISKEDTLIFNVCMQDYVFKQQNRRPTAATDEHVTAERGRTAA